MLSAVESFGNLKMPLLALLIPGLVQVLTKPWIYVSVIAWLVVSKFDIGVFAEEARKTIWSLWPFVVMFFVFLFAIEVLRLKLRGTDEQR